MAQRGAGHHSLALPLISEGFSERLALSSHGKEAPSGIVVSRGEVDRYLHGRENLRSRFAGILRIAVVVE